MASGFRQLDQDSGTSGVGGAGEEGERKKEEGRMEVSRPGQEKVGEGPYDFLVALSRAYLLEKHAHACTRTRTHGL